MTTAQAFAEDAFLRFSDAYERKYGRRPGNPSIVEVYLFRLAPR